MLSKNVSEGVNLIVKLPVTVGFGRVFFLKKCKIGGGRREGGGRGSPMPLPLWETLISIPLLLDQCKTHHPNRENPEWVVYNSAPL